MSTSLKKRELKCKFSQQTFQPLLTSLQQFGQQDERLEMSQISGASCPTFSVGHGSPHLTLMIYHNIS